MSVSSAGKTNNYAARYPHHPTVMFRSCFINAHASIPVAAAVLEEYWHTACLPLIFVVAGFFLFPDVPPPTTDTQKLLVLATGVGQAKHPCRGSGRPRHRRWTRRCWRDRFGQGFVCGVFIAAVDRDSGGGGGGGSGGRASGTNAPTGPPPPA